LAYTSIHALTGLFKGTEMNKHTVICPDGLIITHSSKTKKYSHCVVVWYEWNKKWGVVGWASRFDLAQKVFNKETSILNSGIASKNKEVQEYCERNYGKKLQCQILTTTID
jgi:hypothetical protein